MFPSEFCEVSKNFFFHSTPLVAASESYFRLLKASLNNIFKINSKPHTDVNKNISNNTPLSLSLSLRYRKVKAEILNCYIYIHIQNRNENIELNPKT